MEKQPFRVPALLVLAIGFVFAALFVNTTKQIIPLYNDYVALQALNNSWPSAQAHFVEPLTLIVSKSTVEKPTMVASYRYGYTVGDETTHFSDHFEIGKA